MVEVVVAIAAVQPASGLGHLLDPAERARVQLLPDHDAATTAHALLRLLLTGQTGRPAASHGLGRRCGACGGPHGRPRHPDLHVSLARTPLLVAAAVCAAAPVGLDVELVARAGDPALDAVLLGPGEHATTAADRTRLWTRKEALLKATGEGLAHGSLSVDLPTGAARAGAHLVDVPAPTGACCTAAVLVDDPPSWVVVDGDALLSRAGRAAARGPATGAAAPADLRARRGPRW